MLGFLTLNIMLLLISFVVHVGAETEFRHVVVQDALGDLRVRDVMSPLDAGVAASESLLGVADRMIRERRTAYPVIDGGRVIGFITATAVKRFAPDVRDRTVARDAVRPAGVADGGAKLADVLHLLGEIQEIAVVEADRLVGTLSQLDLVRGLDLRDLAAPAPGAGVDRHVSGAKPRRAAL